MEIVFEIIMFIVLSKFLVNIFVNVGVVMVDIINNNEYKNFSFSVVGNGYIWLSMFVFLVIVI